MNAAGGGTNNPRIVRQMVYAKTGGFKGFALRGGLALATTVGTGLAVNKMIGGGEEQAPQLDVPEAPATPAMGAFGGGFASLKDLFFDLGHLSFVKVALGPTITSFSS